MQVRCLLLLTLCQKWAWLVGHFLMSDFHGILGTRKPSHDVSLCLTEAYHMSLLQFCYYDSPKEEEAPYLNQHQTGENYPLKITDCIGSSLLIR